MFDGRSRAAVHRRNARGSGAFFWVHVLAAAFATLVAAPRIARAASSWAAPPECPAPSEWVTQTGSDLHASDVQVAVTQVADAWTARIVAAYGTNVGSRQLTASSCAEITQAVLVALSLMNGKEPPVASAPGSEREPGESTSAAPSTPARVEASPNATAAFPLPPGSATTNAARDDEGVLSDPEPSQEATPDDTTLPPPATRSVRTADDGFELTWRGVSLGPAFVVSSEGNRAAAFGGGLAAAAWFEPLALRVEASVRAPVGGVLGDAAVQLDFQLFAGRVDACLFTDRWGAWVAVCAGPLLQLLNARATSIAGSPTDAVWLGGASGSISVRSGPQLFGFGAWIEARGEGRADRPGFNVEPHGSVFEFPEWSGVLLTGVEAWF